MNTGLIGALFTIKEILGPMLTAIIIVIIGGIALTLIILKLKSIVKKITKTIRKKARNQLK